MTLDTLVHFVNNTVLNPVLPIALTVYLYISARNSGDLQFDERNIPLISSLPQALKTSLGYLVATLAIRLNAWASHKALNNGTRDRYDWNNEIVVVTGGSGGIGGEVVKQLASNTRTKIAVLDVLPLTYSKPANVDYYKCDLTDPDSLGAAANKIRSKWGDPTVLCCIAGIVRHSTLLDAPRTFGVNVFGLAACYKEFVPSMAKNNHGHVVTVASQTAYLPAAGMVHYAASKSAALALHEGLGSELKHIHKAPKVRTTVICPSVVSTKMFDGLEGANSFMYPTLKPEDVAASITSALRSTYSQHVELPVMGKRLTPLTRAMPAWYRVAFQDAAKDSMTTFAGHKVIE